MERSNRSGSGSIKTELFRIEGMSCMSCQNRIEQKLISTEGIKSASVSYRTGTAQITYDSSVIIRDDICKIVESLGYGISGDTSREQGRRTLSPAARICGLLAVIITAAMLFSRWGPSLFSVFPTAEAGMGLGMMFVIGLITSVHCAAMCGGICLSQTLGRSGSPGGKKNYFIPGLLYNAGRVASYTAVGALAGGIGSVFTFSGTARGAVQIAAGIFMLVMGINILGIFPVLRYLTPHIPRGLTVRLYRIKNGSIHPFVTGLLNGLMPCGPLQAMQLYALSTGSAGRGALSMLLFALGTVPLMFVLGVMSTALSGKFTHRVMTAGACIIAVMGITMFLQGWVLSGLPSGSLFPDRTSSVSQSALKENGIQTVSSTFSSGRYPSITVQSGIPVKWIIHAPAGSINGCNNRMVIPEYNIEYQFKPGDNTITFTPDKTGTFRYSCWMGMIRSSITVVKDKAAVEAAAAAPDPLEPEPAGYTIPVTEVAVAHREKYEGRDIQTVRIALTDDGFSPAVVVLQKNIPARWVINNVSDDDGSAELRVPAYTSIIPLKKRAENSLFVMPQDSFGFSTGDSIFFGYVKIADDITKVDTAAVKKEAAAFETLVYPDDYYNTGTGGCCANRYTGRAGGA